MQYYFVLGFSLFYQELFFLTKALGIWNFFVKLVNEGEMTVIVSEGTCFLILHRILYSFSLNQNSEFRFESRSISKLKFEQNKSGGIIHCILSDWMASNRIYEN